MGEGGILHTVPVQGAYVAIRCPVAAQLRYDDSIEVGPEPLNEADQARVDAGSDFEREIISSILDHYGPGAVVVDGGPRPKPDRQRDTGSAMASGASVVVGGWLPDDPVGRRTGQPDVLVRLEDGWAPIDVKHHGVVISAPTGSELMSEVTGLHPDAAAVESVVPTARAREDVLQLAHYRRLLEATGLASSRHWGGIIGRHGTVWWCDLAERRWERGASSALDIYDREFDLRLRVIARQVERNADGAVPRLVIPLRKSECQRCPWYQVCDEELRAGDSVSLVTGVTWSDALGLTRHGVATRSDLAGLDGDTARVAYGDSSSAPRVDLAEVLGLCQGLPTAMAVGDALGKRKRTRLARLEAHGITTVGDLASLDRRTVAVTGLKVGYLPGLIDQARAAVAGRPLRRRGIDRIDVPRADVEIDVDMENSGSGVYLWGVRVSRTERTGVSPGYRPFVSWDPLDGDGEVEIFARFWTWMTGIRDATLAGSGTFAAYCYTSAENHQMLKIAGRTAAGPTPDEVGEFLAGPHWVDLYAVVSAQVITGGGLGLKKVAPLAGFRWRDDDPGGDQSMVWYDRAVHHPDPVVREENRARLLTYNEDDVRATAAVREWLDSATIGSVSAWTAEPPVAG